jgi:HSP20 family protein
MQSRLKRLDERIPTMTSTPTMPNLNFAGLSQLPEAVEVLFRDGVVTPVPGGMHSNLLETWDSIWLQIALPGADASSLRVEVVGRKLLIKGKTNIPPIEGATLLRHDLPSGEIFEIFELPAEVDGDNAKAQYRDGILTVRLPQLSYLKPASIPVQWE